jgi:N6-adenosine-specific RNA methylase IME4
MAEPFRVIAADPPWPFADKLPGPSRGAAKNYRVMTIDEIKAFELPPIADDALLFLWRVSAMVPEAYDVARAWGFTPKAELVWVKTKKGGEGLAFGMGRYVRAAHETCIIARRGKATVRSRSIRSVFFAIRSTRHSKKPEAFFRIVEKLSEGPYCELFARERRRKWTCFGDELFPPTMASAAE